ncbi:DUF192 domain-containing protein [Salicola sp. Rm-C-2C1-2]|uniref:DUF192 domain-containing protein n=1 Tax=Salicola sp. Rm-C-2C1-2 TaxID=3141321 RepID=UPI0032E517FD
MKRVAPGLIVVLSFLGAGCGSFSGEDAPDAVTLCLPAGERAVPLKAELATSPEQRQKGLSERSQLPRRSGMLFIYPNEQGVENSFWMHQTHVPLTILFLDEQGVVRSIQDMTPCLDGDGSQCASYEAGVSHWMALEVNQGLPQALGVSEGDIIRRSQGGAKAACETLQKLTPRTLPRAY